MKTVQKIFQNNTEHYVIKLFFIKIAIRKKIKNCVAVVNPGGIGDYILHRPFFKYFKNSKVFEGKKLIFIGREIYNNMVKNYDGDVFYDILAYDSKNKRKSKKELSKYKFDTLIHLQTMCGAIAYPQNNNSIRTKFIRKLNAKTKITNVIKNEFYDKKSQKYLKQIYNKLIYTTQNEFELNRLKIFYEQLLKLNIPDAETAINPIFNFTKKYICISPASVGEYRNYSVDGWIKIINYILDHTKEDTQIVILGTKREEDFINEIFYGIKSLNKIVNLVDLTDTALIPSIIKNSEFLLSIETGTIHIAQSVGCKAVCLSSGGFYGRFLPYKNGLIEYIFPDGFDEIVHKGGDLSKFYDYEKTYKASDIRPEKVINVIKKYLNN